MMGAVTEEVVMVEVRVDSGGVAVVMWSCSFMSFFFVYNILRHTHTKKTS